MTESDRDSGVTSTSIFAGGLIPPAESEPDTGAIPVPTAIEGLDSLAPGTALLVVKRGPNAGSRFVLEADVVNAGRHPESDIFLDDVTVSRRHAEFQRTQGSYRVTDTGSLNGTYVNREAVDTSYLVNGDEVQIGKFRLVFLTGSPAESAPDS